MNAYYLRTGVRTLERLSSVGVATPSCAFLPYDSSPMSVQKRNPRFITLVVKSHKVEPQMGL